jgi:PAS domain S-box-containing protein
VVELAGEEKFVTIASPSLKLRELRKKAGRLFHRARISLSYVDNDGDEIKLKRSRDLRLAIRAAINTGRGVLVLQGASTNRRAHAIKEEMRALAHFPNPVVMCDARGVINYVNPAAESWFGYPRAVLIGAKVNILMPTSYAIHHDEYINRYLATGEGRIIGTGRKVIATKRNGTETPVFLTITESQTRAGRHFVATFQDLEATPSYVPADLTAHCTLLQPLLDAAIVINQAGLIQFINGAATTLFGYTPAQVIGQNVSMLMLEPERSAHDLYLQRYLTTGQSTVLDRGREVVAVDKQGRVLKLHLSVTEERLGAQRIFTGFLRLIDSENVSGSSSEEHLDLLGELKEMVGDLLVATIVIDDHGLVLYINPVAESLLGYAASTLVNQNIKMIMTPEDAAHHDDYLAAWRAGGPENIFGIGRDVLAVHGLTHQTMMVRLSVSKRRGDDGRWLCIGTIVPRQ